MMQCRTSLNSRDLPPPLSLTGPTVAAHFPTLAAGLRAGKLTPRYSRSEKKAISSNALVGTFVTPQPKIIYMVATDAKKEKAFPAFPLRTSNRFFFLPLKLAPINKGS